MLFYVKTCLVPRSNPKVRCIQRSTDSVPVCSRVLFPRTEGVVLTVLLHCFTVVLFLNVSKRMDVSVYVMKGGYIWKQMLQMFWNL